MNVPASPSRGCEPGKRVWIADDADVRGFPCKYTNLPPAPKVQVVVSPDPILEAEIRESINKPTGDILDTGLVGAGFESFSAHGLGIVDRMGLEYCTDLQHLRLFGNYVTDIGPLSTLINLETLEIFDNNISDVAALSGLQRLRYLQLAGNSIHNELNLAENKISDLSPLAAMNNLLSVNLRSNRIVSLDPLPDALALGKVDPQDNPLGQDALCNDIPVLQERGGVLYDGVCTGVNKPIETIAEELLAGFDAADTDGDGSLSRAEVQARFPALTPAAFDYLDADNDGLVSGAELLEVAGISDGCDGIRLLSGLGDLLCLGCAILAAHFLARTRS